MKLTRHLNTPLKVWAWVGVTTIAIPALVWSNVILPISSEAEEARLGSTSESQMLMSARANLEAAQNLSSTLPDLLEQSRQVYTLIPDSTESDVIINAVRSAAGRAGIVSISTSDPQPSTLMGDEQEGVSELYEVEIRIQIAGPTKDVLQFPTKLTDQKRLFVVDSVSFGEREQGSSAAFTVRAWIAEGDLVDQANTLQLQYPNAG